MQRQLKAVGMKLHSQDLAPWGSWGVFNVTALARCVDYVVPMAYCSPASGTFAGPTDPLDQVVQPHRLHNSTTYRRTRAHTQCRNACRTPGTTAGGCGGIALPGTTFVAFSGKAQQQQIRFCNKIVCA